MTTRITRIHDRNQKRTTLRVEGSLHSEDAEVLERVYSSLRESYDQIAIDLADISFVDGESASVLRRLQSLGAELVGLNFFAKTLLELAQDSID
jgi:ABC-type transporter Mla MlaB component